jgi:ELWxxDGT repeat protein
VHRRMIITALLLFIFFTSPFGPQRATAKTDPLPNPDLIKNVYTAETESSSPINFMPVGPESYFFARQSDSLYALWKTDGTPEGTTLIQANVRPSTSDDYDTLNGFLYYAAIDDTAGEELWRTDLATGETGLFVDIDSGSYSSSPSNMTTFDGRLYFTSGWGNIQNTDGTPEGTTRHGRCGTSVHSPFMEFHNALYFSAHYWDCIDNDYFYLAWFGSGGSGQSEGLTPGKPLVVYKDRLYFSASRADVGEWEMFSTAGTQESISLLKDTNPGGDAFIQAAVEYNGLLYFISDDTLYGQRLWVSDGTGDGTVPVLDLPDGLSMRLVSAVQPSGPENPGGLLLAVSGPGEEHRLWRFDGTEAGTQVLADLRDFVAEDEYEPVDGVLWNQFYYFHAWDAEHGEELWRTDGTVAGTQRLADISSGPRGSMPSRFSPCGSRLCFAADDGIHGKELWSTDSTSGNIILVADQNTHPANAYPGNFTPAGGLLYFIARDSVADANLWRTDGTSDGTFALNADPALKIQTDLYDYNPRQATLGSTLFFPASDPAHGEELWKTDGTPGGTTLVKEISPGETSSKPNRLMVARDRLFFIASTPEAGEELWVSDGTESGTHMVKELVSNNNYIFGMSIYENRALISVRDLSTESCELWISDGEASGTTKISDDLCMMSLGTEYDGKLFFPAMQKGDSEGDLWETDGTPVGTRKINKPDGYYSWWSIYHISTTEQAIFFTTKTNYSESMFQLPKGADQSTFVYTFYDINGVYESVKEIAGFGSQVAVVVNMYAQEVLGPATQLWVSDGSEAGTRRIQAGFSEPSNLISLGSTLFFSASDPEHGMQIWRTDGTNTGTRRVTSYAQTRCTTWDTASSSLAFFKGMFVLSLDDASSNPPGSGCELWGYNYLTEKNMLPLISR